MGCLRPKPVVLVQVAALGLDATYLSFEITFVYPIQMVYNVLPHVCAHLC